MQISGIKKLKIQSFIKVKYGLCFVFNKGGLILIKEKGILEACCVSVAISRDLKSTKR